MKHNFDMICLPDISRFVHSTWLQKLHLSGCKLARIGNPNPNVEQVNTGWATTAKWRRNDTVTTEDTEIDSITTSLAVSQITSGPTHILTNSSCIDLSFTN